MGFWDSLFRHSKREELPSVLNDAQRRAMKIFEQSLRQHVSRMKTHHVAAKGFALMETRWDKLLHPDILCFTTSAIDQDLRKSLSDHLHHYRGRRFEDIYVAVSTIPDVNPSKARAYFGCGYLEFLEVLANESDFGSGGLDLAHWIFCYDGRQQAVHLTFMPDVKMIESQGPNTISVLAQDLMTDAERSEAGIL